MASQQHFTIVDDWVALNPEITSTEYRVYSIVKGSLRHSYGTPETGFGITASWVVEMANGIISLSTAHKALQGLAKKGVLRRLTDPHAGVVSQYEIVVVPPENYGGERSIMKRAARVKADAKTGVVFMVTDLTGHPTNGRDKPVKPKVPKASLDMAPASSMLKEPDVEEAPLDEDAFKGVSEAEEQFARALLERTGRKSETHLRLMEGACFRLAELARPALERGWDPDRLAARLAAELNPKIHSPERFLSGKFKDIGLPPASRQEPDRHSAARPEPDPVPSDEAQRREEAMARGREIIEKSRARRIAGRGMRK